MSDYYAESNTETSRELFEKRTIYNSDAANSVEGYTNLVNFNFGEKFLYGRVNKTFVPIERNDFSLKLDNFNTAQPLFAINFVVEAFRALQRHFGRCAASGKIDDGDPYLSTLQVYKAWVDPGALYSSHLQGYSNTMLGAMRAKDVEVRNFRELIVNFEALIEGGAKRFPYTKPAFIKSRFCPINVSGLAVEIADLDAANDDEKINQFINSKNWEFYVQACRTFGFMVDRNVPWRLVADIGSTPMLEFAAKFGFGSTDFILGSGYKFVHIPYFNNFKYFLLDLYNKARLPSFIDYEECNGVSVPTIITPATYTIEQLSNIYGDEYFLKLYCKVRFVEEESHFEDYEKEMLIDDTIELFQSNGLAQSLGVFERILNKPFDYRGSLGYIKEYVDQRAAELT